MRENERPASLSWRRGQKYTDFGPIPADVRRNIRGDNEKQAVLGLILDAKEKGADVVAFMRDEDGDPERTQTIKKALALAGTCWPNLRVVGDTAVPALEAWILALTGEHGTEMLGKAKSQRLLAERGVTTTAQMVDEVMAGRQVPKDAHHLNAWSLQAKTALATPAERG